MHYQMGLWLCNTTTLLQNYQTEAFLPKKNMFPDVVQYNKEDLMDFEQGMTSNKHFLHSAWSNTMAVKSLHAQLSHDLCYGCPLP